MTNDILDALSACIRLSRKQLEQAAASETMTATEIVACGALCKPWVAGAFQMNDIRQYEGIVYRCCQPHDSGANPAWSPDTVPALWTQYHTMDPARAVPYAQPTGEQDAYDIGECVLFEGAVYRCIVDATVHHPEALPTAWERVEEA